MKMTTLHREEGKMTANTYEGGAFSSWNGGFLTIDPSSENVPIPNFSQYRAQPLQSSLDITIFPFQLPNDSDPVATFTMFEVSHDDFIPLFLFLETKEWGTCVKEAKRAPQLIEDRKTVFGFFGDKAETRINALHQAVAIPDCPTSVIEAFCKFNPKCLQSLETAYRRTALHIACMKGTDYKIIGTLLQFDDDKCAQTPDSLGRLPIHYAAKNRTTNGDKTLRLLLRAHPISLMVQDKAGFSPLHVACRMGQSMAMIRLFLRTAPDSIVLRTLKKSYAVHCAKQCTGVWSKEHHDEILDYLKTVTEVTRGTLKVSGYESISYLGKEDDSMRTFMDDIALSVDNPSVRSSRASGRTGRRTVGGGSSVHSKSSIPIKITMDVDSTSKCSVVTDEENSEDSFGDQ